MIGTERVVVVVAFIGRRASAGLAESFQRGSDQKGIELGVKVGVGAHGEDLELMRIEEVVRCN